MLIGISTFTAALLALVFMLGKWRGERVAARAHVETLDATRHALNRQRYYLEQQREALERRRGHLDRLERMPDSAAVRPHPGSSGDTDPTREIDVSTFGRPDQWYTAPDRLNKRRHRRLDDTEETTR